GVDVLFVGARQRGEDRSLDLAADPTDALLVARRGGGETGLDHVHAQVAQDMSHLQLGFGRHGEAGRLFAVAQGGVEDDDAVGIGRRDLGGSGYSFYSGHYAASDWKVWAWMRATPIRRSIWRPRVSMERAASRPRTVRAMRRIAPSSAMVMPSMWKPRRSTRPMRR